MKRTLTTIAACWVTLAAWSQSSWNTNLTLNALIPDNDPNGFADAIPVAGLTGPIANVTVTLDITGGFNGDLYAYLAGPSGGFAVLLNRMGLSSSNAFGYSDAGLNVTFSAGAANGNIHNYQNVPGYATLISNGSDWMPDGRNMDPQSAGGAFDSAAVTANFNTFFGTDPNGTWTFFISDLSPGGQSSLAGLGLDVTVVPEPQTGVLMGLAALLGISRLRNRFRR